MDSRIADYCLKNKRCFLLPSSSRHLNYANYQAARPISLPFFAALSEQRCQKCAGARGAAPSIRRGWARKNKAAPHESGPTRQSLSGGKAWRNRRGKCGIAHAWEAGRLLRKLLRSPRTTRFTASIQPADALSRPPLAIVHSPERAYLLMTAY